MIKCLSLFITLLFLSNSFAIKLKIDKQTPLLFSLLITESLESEKLTSKQVNDINEELNKLSLDSLAYIDKELVKFTLSQTKSLKKKYQILDQSMYEQTQKNLDKISLKRPYSKIIYQALLMDIGELLTDRELITYKNYLKTRTSKLDKQTSIFKNKMDLVTPWIRLLEQSTKEELDNKLDVFSTKSLNHALDLIKILKRSSRLVKNTQKNVTYIKVQDPDLDKARSLIQDLSFKVVPQNEPNYQAPKVLPKAVDLWVPVDETIIEDGAPLTKDQLFPEPEQDYTPPKVLPKPIDNW